MDMSADIFLDLLKIRIYCFPFRYFSGLGEVKAHCQIDNKTGCDGAPVIVNVGNLINVGPRVDGYI